MSMDFTYFAVRWDLVQRRDSEQELISEVEAAEEGDEELDWFFRLSDDVSTSLNYCQFSAMAWLDRHQKMPDDIWEAVTNLLSLLDPNAMGRTAEPLGWSPSDREYLWLAASPDRIQQWITDFDAIDWKVVVPEVQDSWPEEELEIGDTSANDVMAFLQMWRDGFGEIAERPGFGLLSLLIV